MAASPPAHAAGLESRHDAFLDRLFDHSFARLSLLSSHSSERTDFHNLKTLTNDDGGGEAEKKTPANQNLVSVLALLRPAEGQEFFAAALQSPAPAPRSERARAYPGACGCKAPAASRYCARSRAIIYGSRE